MKRQTKEEMQVERKLDGLAIGRGLAITKWSNYSPHRYRVYEKVDYSGTNSADSTLHIHRLTDVSMNSMY